MMPREQTIQSWAKLGQQEEGRQLVRQVGCGTGAASGAHPVHGGVALRLEGEDRPSPTA